MAPSGSRCQRFEQDRPSAKSQGRRHCCRIWGHKRCSFLRAAQGKYATLITPYVRDLHKSVLLKNTILHLQDPSQGSQDMALMLEPPPGVPPWQETSQGPPAESEGATSLEPTEEAQSAEGSGQVTAADMGMCAPAALSSPCQDDGGMANEGRLPDPLPDPFPCTADEVLYFGEGLQQPLPLAGPRTDSPSAWPSESAAACPEEEAGVWDAFWQEELLRDPLFGSLEIVASGDIPAEDFFADIDMSEFESILRGPPSNAQAAAENTPQGEAPSLPGQDASSRVGSLDQYMELLLQS